MRASPRGASRADEPGRQGGSSEHAACDQDGVTTTAQQRRQQRRCHRHTGYAYAVDVWAGGRASAPDHKAVPTGTAPTSAVKAPVPSSSSSTGSAALPLRYATVLFDFTKTTDLEVSVATNDRVRVLQVDDGKGWMTVRACTQMHVSCCVCVYVCMCVHA
jgi:hypothetical protein